MELTTKTSGVPFIDQYVGVWAIYEPSLQSLKAIAEQVNINVHMSGEPSAVVAAVGGLSAITNSDGIAVIELQGTLLKHSSSFSANTSTAEARRLVRAAKNDPDVSGVLFRIDSPGGTVAGTDDLAADIRSLQSTKPTMAFIEDLGASAAYWLAAQTGTVFSNASAIVGSIGVLTVVYDLSRKADAENITVHVIKAGEMKGAGVPGSVITDDQLAEWQKLIDSFYADFISAVATGRNIPKARARELADGRVHTGQVAADLGLTDGVRSLDDALAELTALTQKGKRSASLRGLKMSEETVDVVAKAATIKELKAALPKADSDFILQQFESGATLADAQTEYIALQDALLAEREAALEAAQKATVNPEPAKVRIQKPLSDSGEADLEPVDFESLVAEMMIAKNTDRRTASRYVQKQYPEAHSEFLDRAPAGRS